MKQTRETVILFGSAKDPDVQASINRVAITGRKVQVKPTPSHDSNESKCGRLCHCKHACAMHTEQTAIV